MKTFIYFLFTFSLVVLSSKIYAQSGELDPSFGVDGIAMYDLIGDFHETAYDMEILDDGSILLVGIIVVDDQFTTHALVLKLNPEGSIQTEWGDDGMVTVDLAAPGQDTYAYKLEVLSNGDFLISGMTFLSQTNSEFFVTKIHPDGSLVEDFGVNGSFVGSNSAGYDDAYCMTVQDDGKIVLAGNTGYGSGSNMLFMRLNEDGTLDNSFGNSGYSEINSSISFETVNGIAIASNGNIVGAGYAYRSDPYWTENAVVVMLGTSGDLINSFGVNGVYFPEWAIDWSYANDVEILDDEIYITGWITPYEQNVFLSKIDMEGNLDLSFGTDGVTYFSYNPKSNVFDLYFGFDEKIYICGNTGGFGAGAPKDILVVRYDMGGIIDTTFNEDGFVTTEVRIDSDAAFSIKLQDDGKIVVAGMSSGLNTTQGNNIVAIRYLNNVGVNANFTANETEICINQSVEFTDESMGEIISWEWAFEGGTPSTSTDQNPSVVYSTAGYYDVSLTVMNAAGNSETETKPNYISVLETPAQADTPSGDDQLCTGMTYVYSINTIPFAETYEWELIPASAGTLFGSGTEIELEASDTWTGDFTLRVRATNICDDGAWSDDLNGSVNLTPNIFDLIGGGEICEGDPGVEIELMGSETGINYELYNYEVPTGNIVAGTGEGISFGLFTVEGNYTAYGFSANCSINMTGEVPVIVSLLSEQLTMPAGTTEVCNDDENEYTTTGAQGSDNVIWSLDPENAGEISSDGMTVLIIWNNTFEGTASLSVLAENSCGSGPDSDALEIMVMASPTPEITGDDLVCKEEVSVYSTTENAGNTYGWEVIGGVVSAGEGTSEITVTWGNTPGQGYVIINESLELGCSAVDSLSVTIDDCTGIENKLLGNDFKVYPNPASSNLNVNFSAKKGEKVEISIYNSMGQLVMQKQEIASGENQTSNFNIESLPKGIYVINVKTSKQAIWQSKIDKY